MRRSEKRRRRERRRKKRVQSERKADFVLPSAEGELGYPEDMLQRADQKAA